MKKILLFLLCINILLPKIDASTSTANSYILMDMASGRVLESKNMNSPQLIASITKIMTCILAIENANVSDMVTINDSILKSYGSGIYISVGEEISLMDLLYGLMLRSGNDAALAISNYVSGSEEEFVLLMNKKAKELGMKNTKFYNSNGLDTSTIGNISTCYDMALLTRYAMKNEVYREIVKTKKHVVKTNLKTYIWYNKNKLLNYDYITGGKTGYTERAKRTLVSTASKDNIDLIVVTIKDSDDWNTHKTLYENTFNNYINYKILNKENFSVPGDKYYDNLYIKNDISVTLKKGETDRILSYIKLEKLDNYEDRQKVGVNYIYLDDTLIHQEDIYVRKNKIKNNNNIFKKIKMWFK